MKYEVKAGGRETLEVLPAQPPPPLSCISLLLKPKGQTEINEFVDLTQELVHSEMEVIYLSSSAGNCQSHINYVSYVYISVCTYVSEQVCVHVCVPTHSMKLRILKGSSELFLDRYISA